ncbi:MAG: DUF3106 domain-containing protein, partial [Pseudoxanthomonas sp.]
LAARQARLAALAPAERAQLDARLARWQALTPLERGRQRRDYALWQALAPAERARLQAAAAQFAALPPEQQAQLRQAFEQLDGSEREGWRLGLAGAEYPGLLPLLGWVPAAERAPLLQALAEMDAGQRAQLAVLAQRTPPSERDALRNDLLAQPPQARGEWLRQRLQH